MISIHPFPARMAPEIALGSLANLDEGSLVLDPMVGSGTVLRQAAALGHHAVGFDLDPLAVLISRVGTTHLDDEAFADVSSKMLGKINALGDDSPTLPWIDSDPETLAFIKFWFAAPQERALRRIALALSECRAVESTQEEGAALNALHLALSRIIITKERGASLARDVSHSRPHKVATSNDFEVVPEYRRSASTIQRRLRQFPLKGRATASQGDARRLSEVASRSVDRVMTSPPYLNAIDYMRGHRMSLVWLGHSLAQLRHIRSDSIGSERRANNDSKPLAYSSVRESLGSLDGLPNRVTGMIDRYICDLVAMVAEVARVLKCAGEATFVVGDSCVRGTFIENSAAVAAAATASGMTLLQRSVRDLPSQSRYLPLKGDALAKRMRTETVFTFAAP